MRSNHPKLLTLMGSNFVLSGRLFTPLLLSLLLVPLDTAFAEIIHTPDENTYQISMVPAGEEHDIVPDPIENNWLDNTENYFSEVIHDISHYVDEGLARGEDDEDLINRSYLKIRLQSEYSHRGYYTSKSRIKARVDFPHIKKNWKIILETDPDDFDSLETKQRDFPIESRTTSSGAIGGVRLQDEKVHSWLTSFDIGVKIRWPLDPFVRAQAERVEDLSDKWTAQLKPELFYFDSKGAGSVTELNFYRAFEEDPLDIFRFSNSAQYLYEERGWELVGQLGYFDRINTNHLLEYTTGISAEPQDDEEISNTWISVAWKQRLYKKWLYLTVTPFVDFPRDYDYKANPGIVIELEGFFSKHREQDYLYRSIPASTRRTTSN
ncbi:hypothetical protein [Vibrio hannami]